MNASFTILAMSMAGWGVLPPERIPPADVSPAAYERLDCRQLLRAAVAAEADLDVAWDRHDRMLRFHRFPLPPAPPPMIRRVQGDIAQFKGELEAIWRVSDRKGCEGRAAEEVAWSPGDPQGPMAEPDDEARYGRMDEALPPPSSQPAWLEGPPPEGPALQEPEDPFPEPVAESESEAAADLARSEEDLAPPAAGEPLEVDGYGEPEPREPGGSAAWPEPAEDRVSETGDVAWPAPAAAPENRPVSEAPSPPAAGGLGQSVNGLRFRFAVAPGPTEAEAAGFAATEEDPAPAAAPTVPVEEANLPAARRL